MHMASQRQLHMHRYVTEFLFAFCFLFFETGSVRVVLAVLEFYVDQPDLKSWRSIYLPLFPEYRVKDMHHSAQLLNF